MTDKIYFDETTTIEDLEYEITTSGAVLKYGEFAIAVMVTDEGYVAAIYKFTETPKEDGYDWVDAPLYFIEQADGFFKDTGHAVRWAFDRMG